MCSQLNETDSLLADRQQGKSEASDLLLGVFQGTGKLPRTHGVWTVLAPLALKMRAPKMQSNPGFYTKGSCDLLG